MDRDRPVGRALVRYHLVLVIRVSSSPTLRASLWTGIGLGSVLGAGLGFFVGSRSGADVQRYRQIRDYARSAFVRDLSDEEVLDKALHGLADKLDDYSQYYDPREAAQLERETVGRYSGLGVVMKRPFTEGRILYPMPGGPAQAAGLLVGDRLVKIAGKPFAGLTEAQFRALVVSAEDRDLELTVVGLDGRTRDVTLRTESVLEPTVLHERMIDSEHRVGYLTITSFSHETPGEFTQAFTRLRAEGMRALVLDLRGNPGGVLSASVEMARRFLPEGLIVSTEGRGELTLHSAERDAAWWPDFPLVVLVDEGSASASEVLAGALQEHRAAVLVGSRTYGKGMVQTIHRFPEDGSVLKLTTSYYYTPSHKNLEHSADTSQERGLQPDLRVDVSSEEKRAIHEYLTKPSPPREALGPIAAWERAEHVILVDPHPRDAQLDAAVALLSGRRPGPHPLRETP